MNYLSLSSEQVEIINDEHIHSVDKLYRMHAGISSRLKSVKNGIAHLEVEIHSRWEKTNEVTVKQFIESWGNHNPDLKNIDGWGVRIYSAEKVAGFTLSPNEIDSIQTQRKINLINANPERYLEYVYQVYNDNIKHPIITLNNAADKFNLEFACQFEVIKCGFFDITSSKNNVIYNSNISGNLFIIPHTEDDYLVITGTEYGNLPKLQYLKASTTPVTYSFHNNLIHLINLSKESTALLFWKEMLTQNNRDGIMIGTRNC